MITILYRACPWFTLLTEKMIVCLRFLVQLENFTLIGDVTISGEGLQIMTYDRHLWPMSNEGYIACYTYYDTGHPYILVISEDP